ncbi:DUF805 domain-containing protein [Alloalcanivorax gelatiniphagus]|uniref:DUF805 domain-containing protein n=1 Tax=Alloalcanivorax gelatiniphagus TaxID=1194167 RepID=A0ABY2XN99_9GAMM|nr:DUF805 domain-containing protein [Alloalcanivorax gelatiniphagus]TMW13907.1 DUF805 domain-containing protein [Alloalcanivorax gelatiniphagus]|tara:strand:+ start:11222 stop:11767 length:546 start_codon:yes stop_codon:yes gene_type:complete
MNQPYQSPEADLGTAAVETYQPRMFQTTGRLGRARYFVYVMVFTMILYAIMGLAMAAGFSVDPSGGTMMIPMILVVAVLSIFLAVMSIIYGIRRLNDMNMSGWLILLIFVPIANFVIAIMLLFVPGSKGANNYGPKPAPNGSGVIIALVVLLVLFVGGFIGMGAMMGSMSGGMDPSMYQNY